MQKLNGKLVVVIAVICGMLNISAPAFAAKGGKKGEGTRGKIVSISNSELDLQTGGKKDPQTLKVKIDANTVVVLGEGATGALNQLKPGDRVAVIMSGDVASKIIKGGAHHGKKKKST